MSTAPPASATASAVRALRNYAIRRRLIGLRVLPSLAVAALPCLVAVVAAMVGKEEAFQLYGEFIVPLTIYFVVPFVAMFSVLPLLGELYENGAIGYLYIRPAPRWAPLLGIYLGAIIAMIPVLIFAAVAPGLILLLSGSEASLGDWLGRMAGLTGVLILGGTAYGAVCMFFGVWSRRAIIWSVIMLIGWGVVFGGLPGSMRNTSPHRYLLGLAKEWCGVSNSWTGMFVPDPSPPGVLTSILVLTGGSAVFFLLAARAAKRRDVL
jgi:ABC-type transport system involved in multi-copper enzyme maturation permease subunit